MKEGLGVSKYYGFLKKIHQRVDLVRPFLFFFFSFSSFMQKSFQSIVKVR